MSKPIGGGEVLEYVGQGNSFDPGSINDWLLKSFGAIAYVKILVCILIIIIALMLIFRIFRIKSILSPKGIRSELSNITLLKARDKAIIRSNKSLKRVTSIVNKTPFKLSDTSKEYYQYNLDRAGILAAGGTRYMSADEYNALIKICSWVIIGIGIIISILLNFGVGVLIILSSIIAFTTLPILVLRSVVAQKDAEIKEHFLDLYLMLHYVLLGGGKAPTERIMRSYSKTTSSAEMLRFVDNCIDTIETYGELNATRIISKNYKEISEVTKLMRLIRQMNEGANVKLDLEGFKRELIRERKNKIEKKMMTLVKLARASFYVLNILLLQAIISAMAIYLPNISVAQGVFGL